jgi:DNA-binding NarL/FixJ family response regulator
MSPGTINVAVLHAEPSQREALCDFIADAGGFRIVGSAGSDADILELMPVIAAHVLVIDLDSVSEGAVHLLSSVRALSPRTGILLLVQGRPPEPLEELVARGAGGSIQVARAAAELPAALRTIAMGRRYLPTAEVGAA